MDRSERIGLGVSTTGHGLLIAGLALGLFHWSAPRAVRPPAIEVALTDNIALESRAASHEPPQVAQAPDLGPTEPEPLPPAPVIAPPEPQPVPKPEPAKAAPSRAQPTKPAPARPEPAKAAPAKPAEKPRPPRASRLGDDFLKGLDSPAKSESTAQVASGNAPLSAQAARALSAEIRRQLKPYWRAPTGADADKLTTTLRWRLNADGTLASGPTLVEQTGRTASNQPQQQLHIEAAMRAVRAAAAPFRLPGEYYDSWKLIEFSFDKRL